VDRHALGLAARLLVLRGGHRRVDPLGLAHAPHPSGVRRGPRARGARGNRGDHLEHRPLRGLLEPPGDVHHPPLFGYLATTQHTLYFTELGFTAGEASLLLAIGGVLAGGGRALAGLVADRFGGPTAGFLSFSCSLLGMLCLIGMEVRPFWILAAGYVVFLFVPLGSRASIVTVLLSRIAPPAHYGFIFGLLGIGNNLGAALGPWLSGALFDRTGGYLAIYLWAFAIALIGLAALTVFTITTRAPGPSRP
jgi:MFS family permease